MQTEQMSQVRIREIQTWFTDNRRFWLLLAWVTGAVSVAKGLRLPNRWAATQALVDYKSGFVKRGLFGALFVHAFQLGRYNRFVVVSFALLVLLLGVLALYVKRSGLLSRFSQFEVLVLFTSSFGLTYAAHIVGYFDVLLCAIAVLLLLIGNANVRLGVGIPTVIASVLIHELFLVVFLPVVLLSFLLQGAATRQLSEIRLGFVRATVLAAVTGAATFWVAHGKPLSADQMTKLETRLQSEANFPLRPDFFKVMRRSAKDNVDSMTATYELLSWRRIQERSLVTFGPTVVLLLIATWKTMRTRSAFPVHFMMVFAIIATLSPLAMHLIAGDAARWNGWTAVAAFLVLLTVCKYVPGGMVVLGRGFRNVTLLFILLNMATGGMLMDNMTINSYSFIPEGQPPFAAFRPSTWSPPAL